MLQKLQKKTFRSELSTLIHFQDYDCTKCGLLTKLQFQRALSNLNVLCLVPADEFEILCRAFSKVPNPSNTLVDYRSLLNTLDAVKKLQET